MASTLLESGPATKAVAVTPADGSDLGSGVCVALYIGTAGALKVTDMSGTDCTFAAVSAGTLPLRVKRVWSTGTTATNIVALY